MKKWMVPFLAIACFAPALASAGPARHGRTQRTPGMTHAPREPLHVQVARAIFPRESWDRFMKEASTEVTHQLAETGKGQIVLAPGFADRLQEQYQELVPYEEMVDYQARILDSQYSKAELRRLLVFYRTPLGRKTLPFMHDLVDSSMQRAQLKVQNRLAAALAPLRPLVRRIPAPGAPDGAQTTPDAPDAAARGDASTGSGATDDHAL